MLELPVVGRSSCILPPLPRPLLDQPCQILVGGDSRREGERRQRRLELAQPELAPLGDRQRRHDALRRVPPPPQHLLGSLEVPFAVRTQPPTHLIERALVPERAEDVVHGAAGTVRRGVMHIVGDDPWHVERPCDGHQLARQAPLERQVVVPALDGDPPLEYVPQRGDCRAGSIDISLPDERWNPSAGASGQRMKPFSVRRQRIERNPGMSTLTLHPRPGDELRKVAVAGAGLGEKDEMGRARVEGWGSRVVRCEMRDGRG